jgi:hypothetical protein
LGKELLIYDLTTHKAYNLNETCAAVFHACDGKTSLAECRRRNNFTDDVIFLALDELIRENLIESSAPYRSPFEGVSRREAIRKVGLASMISLPFISSLVAPTAAMAQSSGGAAPGSRNLGETCNSSTECASGAPNCNGGICCVGGGTTPNGVSRSFITNGTCPTDPCNSLAGPSCCSGSASMDSCVQLVPGTIQVFCSCS